MSDLLKTVEVSYGVSYSPNPLVIDTSLSIDDTAVKVTIDDVPNLDVTLTPKPSGNPINDVMTAIGSLGNLFSSQISDKVVSEVKGVSITVFNVSDITVDQSGINLTLSPDNLVLDNHNGMMMVSGDINVTGL